MGIIITPQSILFSGLINTPTTILTASEHTLVVRNIIITNRTTDIIKINIQKIRTQAIPVSIFCPNEFELEPFETTNILARIQSDILLMYSLIPSISDSLVCYSNGYTQKFDCDITYTQLNELPLY